ncbi:hypothetical protein PBY51_019609 [Eleginops maclovinus]|uniref:U5 small nuclear ribonucleoprotein TSSC4 n=1 Tax=Eleginops maclovinus TaxID=56733 RepID=A0AAN7YIM6_ELEMC|nr:hypothetical protein PBY51_019609 [Eleginops maclovinus]
MSDQKNGGDHEDDLDELSASDESEPEGGLSSAPFDPELDDDSDDDGGEVALCAPPAGRLAQSPFSLRGGGSAFSNRSHSIFECLDSVARLASSSSSSSSQNHRPVSDGVFARPLPPPPSRKTSQPAPSSPTPAKKRGVPDYLVHPERWTRYNLEDVTETSEQGNTRAAHNFLSSLQPRKEQQESAGDSATNLQHKMIFSRPSGLKEQPEDPPSAATGRDKEARLRLLEEEEEEEEESRKKDTRLSHLEEEEDEEEEEEEDNVEEKEIAEARRTEQRGGKSEEKDTRAAMGGAEEKKKVQKGVQEGEAVPSFKKTKRKNYRKSSGQEDN